MTMNAEVQDELDAIAECLPELETRCPRCGDWRSSAPHQTICRPRQARYMRLKYATDPRYREYRANYERRLHAAMRGDPL